MKEPLKRKGMLKKQTKQNKPAQEKEWIALKGQPNWETELDKFCLSLSSPIYFHNRLRLKSFIRTLLEAQRQEIIEEFITGKRCLTCGKIFDNQGGLADTCEDCFETS